MLFKTLLPFVLVSLSVRATPVAQTAVEELVILSTKETVNGTLTVWGVREGGTTKRDTSAPGLGALTKRCGSNAVTCDSGHTASADSCADLINALAVNDFSLPVSPRSVCLTQSGNQC